MRRILIENARRKSRLKRGGDLSRVDIADVELAAATPDDKILLINEAVEKMEQEDPEKARVVVMKFFGGLTNQEVAETLGVTERTVERHCNEPMVASPPSRFYRLQKLVRRNRVTFAAGRSMLIRPPSPVERLSQPWCRNLRAWCSCWVAWRQSWCVVALPDWSGAEHLAVFGQAALLPALFPSRRRVRASAGLDQFPGMEGFT